MLKQFLTLRGGIVYFPGIQCNVIAQFSNLYFQLEKLCINQTQLMHDLRLLKKLLLFDALPWACHHNNALPSSHLQPVLWALDSLS